MLKPGAVPADLGDVSAASDYDPKIIERFAEQLLRKADTIRMGCAVGGGVFGVLVGGVPMTGLASALPLKGAFGFASVLIGGLVGVLVGYVVGEGRAFRYRVQAQMALFQVEIERKVAQAVSGPRVAPAPAPPVSAAPAQSVRPAPPAPPAPAAAASAPAVTPAPAPVSAPAVRIPVPAVSAPPVAAPLVSALRPPASAAAQAMAAPPLSPPSEPAPASPPAASAG